MDADHAGAVELRGGRVLQALLPHWATILSFARCMSMSRMDFTSTLMDRFASTWKANPRSKET
jgi:hypothetical protein